MWDGVDDPFHDPAKALAGELDSSFFSVPGDHVTALHAHGAEAARGIRNFLDQVTALKTEGRATTNAP